MSATALHLDLPELPEAAETLRAQVRAFVARERAEGHLPPPERIGLGFDIETTKRIAAQGWIGLTWPRQYGGGERTALERYVMNEELLAAALPVGAHWVADRQSGPVLLKFGNDAQKDFYLPRIAAGDCYFCIGMSEPESGSDLASLKARAEKVAGGWRINGRKIWTTNAHRVHYMITLVRTSTVEGSRHAGLSQLIVDLKTPGVTISPIISMAGEHDFNEVLLEDVFVPDDALIGQEGNGWNQVSAELAYERSGPERWLSSFRLVSELIDILGPDAQPASLEELGRLLSHLLSLRQLSMSVASMIQRGLSPNLEASIVKDLGTKFEQEAVRVVRNLVASEDLTANGRNARLRRLLSHAQVYAPAFTIRGGTNEILRGIIARGIGLR
ncbi:acyl-CoA dehydrogenase [Sphingomonas koreensis]|jgi:acyl-CoA dehydrogenase|uniref:Acyl-CoA dehydrogenase n=1 Tax=Sphingomonas koreensis TaxID=93064 RepID=A0A430G7N5_9SPHN|nr:MULTISPECIES: acyl-CoA dehydrogenase family protein [Sphingomonas]MDK2768869.1 acyl-CoA dehydrogenase family protein [Sphingomonas sp.]PKP93910.1 MAG: acyl-CoA dehydrogenase [Alphaproteobacteria bacterium HGW-Alphaproteobacteria-16]PZU59949.1 MAG: acyl-CoA dehydrogenase [Sphingobium sp.]RSY89468.1 acyl-CoA dehydrogenase [Sphingomonas koreensis]